MPETLTRDAVYGVRMLLKSPGVTLAALLSLMLAIGANTLIFSALNAVLLTPLPYAEPGRLVLVWGGDPSTGQGRDQVSFTDAEDFRHSRSLAGLAVFMEWTPALTGSGEPERIPAMQVGDGYFELLQARPLLGRTFLPEEQQEGKDFVVVLSHGLWQRRFGGDPGIVGKTLTLNSRSYAVVGVMPPGFQSLPAPGLVAKPAELYRPVAERYDDGQRDSRHLRALARLAPGATVEGAQAEISAIAARLARDFPSSNTNRGAHVVSLREDTVGPVRPALLILLGAVAALLLIACANIGNLLLARAISREREVAIRTTLGATRGRITRQFLIESLILSLTGGALGLVLAAWGRRVFEAFGPRLLPAGRGLEIDGRVLAFTTGASLLASLLFGAVPALRAARASLGRALKQGSQGSGDGPDRGRLRALLVIAEIAMSLVLVACAALLIRSVSRLTAIDPGFDPAGRLTLKVWLPSARYPTGPEQTAFYDRMLAKVETLPGVATAGLVSTLPLGDFDRVSIDAEGLAIPEGQEPDVDRYIVTPGYLSAMGIPLKAGRGFTTGDRETSAPVVLVSETLARQLWPGRSALGLRVRMPNGKPREEWPWRTVVGIVKDVKQYALDRENTPQMYLPQAQAPTNYMTLVVRSRNGDPTALAAPVRSAIRSLDPDQAVFDVQTMEEILMGSIALRRFSMILLGGFAGLALVLAAVGIYGVMAYSVSRRTREVGIRMVLGAQRNDVLLLILGRGLLLAGSGLGIGLAAALGTTRLMSALLFEVSPTDPFTFAAITLLLATVALAACYLPAAKVLELDPLEALRAE
ncbi:MAG TPA: ABC transporter permease [Thermoanaerobaculia bacterium]|jgi:putative ABC transport system permease protein|nr:ABC transporter permease [Thermoanaerobaculia bacterium]